MDNSLKFYFSIKSLSNFECVKFGDSIAKYFCLEKLPMFSVKIGKEGNEKKDMI
jgi:hypothetical protein